MRAPFLADSLPARLDSNFYPRPTSYLLQRVPLYYYMITSPHAMSHRSAKPVYQAAPPDPIAANPTQIAFYLRRAAALLDQIYAKISGHTTTMPVPPPPPPTSFGFGQPLHPQPNAQQTSTRHSNAQDAACQSQINTHSRSRNQLPSRDCRKGKHGRRNSSRSSKPTHSCAQAGPTSLDACIALDSSTMQGRGDYDYGPGETIRQPATQHISHPAPTAPAETPHATDLAAVAGDTHFETAAPSETLLAAEFTAALADNHPPAKPPADSVDNSDHFGAHSCTV